MKEPQHITDAVKELKNIVFKDHEGTIDHVDMGYKDFIKYYTNILLAVREKAIAERDAFIREAVEGMKERERKHYDKIDKDLELSHHSRGYCNDNCRSGGIKKDSEFNAALWAVLEILK